MKLLLDTHIWIWYLLGDARLSRTHRTLMEDDDNELLLSSISVWEAHMLIEKKRLVVSTGPAAWIRQALRSVQVRETGITFAIAVRSRALAVEHQDPADRFIAATAIEMKLPLLTADQHLLDFPEIRCL